MRRLELAFDCSKRCTYDAGLLMRRSLACSQQRLVQLRTRVSSARGRGRLHLFPKCEENRVTNFL
jgi:hypothetical protein